MALGGDAEIKDVIPTYREVWLRPVLVSKKVIFFWNFDQLFSDTPIMWSQDNNLTAKT
jgi:hypothetical protein